MRPPYSRLFLWVVIGGGTAVLSGCAPSHPLPPPPLVLTSAATVNVRHFLGTPLSGTLLKQPPAFKPEDALAIDVAFVAIEKSPQGVDPLGAHSRLIIASHGDNPVRSTGGLTGSATYAVGNDAKLLVQQIEGGTYQRQASVGKGRGVLPVGVTARFEITDSGKPSVTLPSGLGHRRFEIQISRPEPYLLTRNKQPATAPTTDPDAEPATKPAPPPPPPAVKSKTAVEIELAVELDEVGPPDGPNSGETSETNASPRAATTPILHMETVMLDSIMIEPLAANDSSPTVVLAVPFRFRDGQNQSVVAIIRIAHPSPKDAAFPSDCDKTMRDLLASYQTAQADAANRPPASPDEATTIDLLQAITRPETRRSALAYLAAWSGARFCEDVTLSADDKTLDDLSKLFPVEIKAVAKEKPAVGWRLDRLTLGFLAKRQSDATLPPELIAILADRAGEAGRHPSAMEEILRDVAGPVDLDQRLIATNRLYLEDSSPASRARAYDWLKNRNRHEEPAGYVPLSPARERRAALDKDILDRAAAATRPTTQPTGVP